MFLPEARGCQLKSRSGRHEIPPLKLFVWTVPDISQTIQAAAIAPGFPQELGGKSRSDEDCGFGA